MSTKRIMENEPPASVPVYYDITGQVSTKETDRTALAKHFNGANLVCATADGQLFNPLDSSLSLTSKDRDRGGLKWQLRRCSKECFRSYVAFLLTRSTAHLNVAQRKFNDE